MKDTWMPIKTAPVSDNLILLFDERKRKGYGSMFTGYRVMANKGMDGEKPMTLCKGAYDFVDATHWMPLPEPPAMS